MSSIQYSQSAPTVQGVQGHTGDLISQLPVDQSQPTNNELQIVNSLFTEHRSTMHTILNEAKDSIFIGMLFVIFSLPLADSLLKRVLPITDKSPYILVAIKACCVMALYWLLKHFYLSRKAT